MDPRLMGNSQEEVLTMAHVKIFRRYTVNCILGALIFGSRMQPSSPVIRMLADPLFILLEGGLTMAHGSFEE